MKNYTQDTIGRIFSIAEKTFYRLIEMQALKEGGYLVLYQEIKPGKLEIVQMCHFGEWTFQNTADILFAITTCCDALLKNPVAITSRETEFKMRGSIRLNDSLFLGFAGEENDGINMSAEALVFATAMVVYETNILDGDKLLINLREFRKSTGNPLLVYDENFKQLMGN